MAMFTLSDILHCMHLTRFDHSQVIMNALRPFKVSAVSYCISCLACAYRRDGRIDSATGQNSVSWLVVLESLTVGRMYRALADKEMT